MPDDWSFTLTSVMAWYSGDLGCGLRCVMLVKAFVKTSLRRRRSIRVHLWCSIRATSDDIDNSRTLRDVCNLRCNIRATSDVIDNSRTLGDVCNLIVDFSRTLGRSTPKSSGCRDEVLEGCWDRMYGDWLLISGFMRIVFYRIRTVWELSGHFEPHGGYLRTLGWP